MKMDNDTIAMESPADGSPSFSDGDDGGACKVDEAFIREVNEACSKGCLFLEQIDVVARVHAGVNSKSDFEDYSHIEAKLERHINDETAPCEECRGFLDRMTKAYRDKPAHTE